MQLNIWIFNHYATTPYYVGGTRHFDLSQELTKKGHKVTIFASSYNHFLKKETVKYDKGKYYKEEHIDGVKFVWIKTIKYKNNFNRIMNIFDYTIKSYRAASKLVNKGQPQLIIGSSVHPLAAFVGYKVSKKADAVFYFEERDLWPQTFVDFEKISARNPLAVLLYRFEKFLYNKSERIIVLFDRAVNYVESKGIDNNKVVYLPNGVNIDNHKNLESDDKLKVLMSKYKKTVIYTGSHGIANHLKPIIETANFIQHKTKNKDIHFVLVGDGPLKTDLIKIAESKKLENITFLNPISKEKIPFLLSLADLSIISIKDSPLYKWGFSMNKLYDYMASGLPIMMYANKRVIGDLENLHGISISETSEQLAKNIIDLIYDEEYKKEARESLTQYVEMRYSWSRLATNLENYMLKDIK